jgi:hypothetical protein
MGINHESVPVYFNNCRNRPHAQLFQDDAFFDLDTTGVQANQATDLPVGQECVVVSRLPGDILKFTSYFFLAERLMTARGSTDSKRFRVFLGTEICSEDLPISQARGIDVYAAFFDKNGHFKRQATIIGTRPAMASSEDDRENLSEGAKRLVLATSYERSTVARKRCIDCFGAICRVCAFDFGAVYGQFAAGFIHVHHVRPLCEIGAKYRVDPIKDLVPVCPNCHAVIHLGGKVRGIDEVKELMDVMKNG